MPEQDKHPYTEMFLAPHGPQRQGPVTAHGDPLTARAVMMVLAPDPRRRVPKRAWWLYACPQCNYTTVEPCRLDMICAECPGIVHLDAHRIGSSPKKTELGAEQAERRNVAT